MQRKKVGKNMLFFAWIILFLLLFMLFYNFEQNAYNPNSNISAEALSVSLQVNNQGHYILPIRVNGHEINFLVDTGATNVAISQEQADRIGLPYGTPIKIRTANGLTDAWLTKIDTMQIGGIYLNDIDASILPNLGDNALLGANVLNRLHLNYQGSTLILSPLN